MSRRCDSACFGAEMMMRARPLEGFCPCCALKTRLQCPMRPAAWPMPHSPRSTLCLRIADALGPVYQDHQFAALFPRRGRPAAAPGRLALAVVLQFMENLSVSAACILRRLGG